MRFGVEGGALPAGRRSVFSHARDLLAGRTENPQTAPPAVCLAKL